MSADFVEANRELLDELGMLPGPLAVVEALREGIIEERWVASRSTGRYYRLLRSAGGWQHDDGSCPGWVIRGACAHVKELNMTTDIVPSSINVLALIDDLEDQQIIEGLTRQITKAWVYEFKVSGQQVRGLSAEGVEQAARELATKGEAIREMDVKIEFEDDKEARFVAQAGRYAISPDGREALLDVAIRGKRQSKLMPKSTEPNPFWYEQGVTKAVRNAKLALLPESAKVLILAESLKAGRTRQVESSRQSSRFSPGALREGERQAEAPARQEEPGVTTVDTTSQEQSVAIQEWQDDIASRHGKSIGPVAAWFAKAFPYTKKSSELTQVDAASYIRLLRHVAVSKDGAVPADGAEPEHDFQMPEHELDPVCTVCGLVYVEPEQAALIP